MLAADPCERLGGTVTLGADCATITCPGGKEPCSAVWGEITDICYTYQDGVLRVFASYAIHNTSSVKAENLTAYALVGLNDGVSGFGGGAECQYWQYGLGIPGNSTHTFDHVFTTQAPTLDLSKLSYLYGSLWLQKESPWSCWGITQQAWVQAWDPAPRCGPPAGGDPSGGEPEDGVCCLPDGTCMKLDATDCDSVGGAYISTASDCAGVDCGKILVGDCPKLSARFLDICRTVDETTGDVTIHITAEIENTGEGDALGAELHTSGGWGFTGENQTLLFVRDAKWTGNVLAGQKLQHQFSLNIGTAPTYDTFHPWADVAAWMSEMPCNWAGDSVDSVDPDGSILVCPVEPGTGPGDGSTGACCFEDGTCDELTAGACERRGGEFRGEGSDCRTADCEEGGEPAPEPDPEPDPEPSALPNLWVTDMTGCWSVDVQENVIATVTGIVHNGGQASASLVRARVTADGKSTTVTVGSIAAGGQAQVSASINLGAYGSASWPVQTSITADPSDAITEADETNNTTQSAFPQSSNCP